MSFGRIVKWLLVATIVFFLWKYVLPEFAGGSRSGRSHSSSGGGDSCIASARGASSAWGSGVGRFVNPPYDTQAWSSFRSDVEGRISEAESACSGSGESNTKARGAMHELRSLMSDLDGAIRGGSAFPSDAVQRQESIDHQVDEAGDLVHSGK